MSTSLVCSRLLLSIHASCCSAHAQVKIMSWSTWWKLHLPCPCCRTFCQRIRPRPLDHHQPDQFKELNCWISDSCSSQLYCMHLFIADYSDYYFGFTIRRQYLALIPSCTWHLKVSNNSFDLFCACVAVQMCRALCCSIELLTCTCGSSALHVWRWLLFLWSRTSHQSQLDPQLLWRVVSSNQQW